MDMSNHSQPAVQEPPNAPTIRIEDDFQGREVKDIALVQRTRTITPTLD